MPAICPHRVNLPPIPNGSVVYIKQSNFYGEFFAFGALSRAIRPLARRGEFQNGCLVSKKKGARVPVVVKMNCAIGAFHGCSHRMFGCRSATDTLRHIE